MKDSMKYCGAAYTFWDGHPPDTPVMVFCTMRLGHAGNHLTNVTWRRNEQREQAQGTGDSRGTETTTGS